MKEKIIKHIKSYSILERILLIFSTIALNFDLFYLRSLKDVLAYFKETFLLLFNIDFDFDIYVALAIFYPFFALITASILLGISIFIKKSKARLVIIIINFLISSTYVIVGLFLYLLSLHTISG
ncbi:MAG: hypothetical protein IJ851_00665 [Eubacterium sp.]|nr:hypothetical protein [Eubacterium sp.]